MNLLFFQIVKHCNSRSHGTRASAESSCLVDRPGWGDHFHNFSPAAKNPYRQPSTHNLSEGSHIRHYSEVFLCSSHCKPESGDNLIEYKKHIIFLSELPEFLQVAGKGSYRAYVSEYRLYYHCSELISILFHKPGHCFNIIVWSLKSVLREIHRNAQGIRFSKSCSS